MDEDTEFAFLVLLSLAGEYIDASMFTYNEQIKLFAFNKKSDDLFAGFTKSEKDLLIITSLVKIHNICENSLQNKQ